MPLILVIGYTLDGRVGVGELYTRAVIECGGLPIICDCASKSVKEYIDIADGVLLVGGGDIRAKIYGENEQYDNSVDDIRDEFEIVAAKYAFHKNKPILGICRGCQVINVALGGDLYPNINAHKNNEHAVTIKKNSVLYECFENDNAVVNSFHHQACRRIADDFVVSAISADGVAEAIESHNGRCIGVQFHPEKCFFDNIGFRRIFEYFVNECKLI